MSARSSSRSSAGAAHVEVIDLDRYMRAPPSLSQLHDMRYTLMRALHSPEVDQSEAKLDTNGRLVVDAGGHTRKPRLASSSSSTPSSPPAAPPHAPPHAPPATHTKRFSHDSGVSDESYTQRRRPPRHLSRRVSAGDGGSGRLRAPCAAAARGSSRSMRAFRSACARELRDQRRQLARVAVLCERLADHQRSSSPSSDVTSSSRSTQDTRNKDKRRTEECKTYKIIMAKLDELNRAIEAKRAPTAARRPAPPADVAVVSDKLVSTEHGRSAYSAQKTKRLVERGVGSKQDILLCDERASYRAEQASVRIERASSRGERRSVTPAYALDIYPGDALPHKHRNVISQNVTRVSSAASAGDARCGFDLDNPMHLYAQAKRIQALHATTTRRPRVANDADERPAAAPRSLCALCRTYWRTVRQRLTQQIFGSQADNFEDS